MKEIFIAQTEEEHKARKTIMEVAYLCLFLFLSLILILSLPLNLASTGSKLSFTA